METNSNYSAPVGQSQIELKVKNSRFVGTAGPASSVESARESIFSVRQNFSDAAHHCYAFSIGHGASVTQGMSDDGEPSGTAGRPMLAVVSGADIGDVFVVASRYFGGTKLGTGGLVRAYSETAKSALDALEIQVKYETVLLHMILPYEYYDFCKARLLEMGSEIQSETYSSNVRIEVAIISDKIDVIQSMVKDITSGSAQINLIR
ncbi:MAG: YigZ family protein [Candidatus Latescibacterota bacterium]|nr:YigZ family protein [Candidatus Latescibacterota bacterium]